MAINNGRVFCDGRRGQWIDIDPRLEAAGLFALIVADGLERIRLVRQPQPGEQVLLHIRGRGRRGQKAVFDFAVFGEDRSPILAVYGYQNVIVNQEPAHVG